jgi:hypothetical protein
MEKGRMMRGMLDGWNFEAIGRKYLVAFIVKNEYVLY